VTLPGDLRPRTVLEILDGAATLARARYGRLVLACTILQLPSLLGSLALVGATRRLNEGVFQTMTSLIDQVGTSRPDPEAMQESVKRMEELSMSPDMLLILGEGLLQAGGRAAACTAMAIAVWHAVAERRVPSTGALLRASVPRMLPAAILQIGLFLSVSCAGMLGCLGLLWMLLSIVAFALFLPVAAVAALERGPRERRLAERGGGARVLLPFAALADAVSRTFSLAGGARSVSRATLLLLVGLTLCQLGVTLVSLFAGFLFGIAGEGIADSFGPIFVAQHYAEVLTLPFFGAAAGLWYVDLRVRREGLDLDLATGPGA
jgi:hypothetical protein